MALRINIGCGQTPTRGWRNFDNSFSLRLAKIPILPFILLKLRIIDNSQIQFIRFANKNGIEFGDAIKGLPIKESTIDVIYSSHMLEHLDKKEATKFLIQAFKLLKPGGIIRIVVPDLKKIIEIYNKSGDANTFIESTLLCVPKAKSIISIFKNLFIGPRNHQWMYDGKSLSDFLKEMGFINIEVLPAGLTKINNHEPLNLKERDTISVYVEAEKPIVVTTRDTIKVAANPNA